MKASTSGRPLFAYRINYNYFRDYDPSIGRYVESDPIGLDGGFNTYAYVKSSPLGSLDPAGLATFKNFPGDKIAAAKAALEEAKQKLQKCKDDGKCDKRKDYLENLIRKMDGATYVYDPSLDDCGFTSYFSLFSVRIGPPAFSFNTCCDLSSTLAHEANHLRNWGLSGSEDASRQLEKECFNCPRRSK